MISNEKMNNDIPFCILQVVVQIQHMANKLTGFLSFPVPGFIDCFLTPGKPQLCPGIAMAVYILFPNKQELRSEIFPRENKLTQMMGFIYTVDTNTGVCPSLHVAYSLGIASAWCREKTVSKGFKTVVMVWCLVICFSVAFVKQHSVVDIFAAIPVCLAAEWFVFFRKKA